jgi:hypothetical protein
MREIAQFYGPRTTAEGRVSLVRLGPLRLWVARARREWGLAVERGEALPLMDQAQVPPDVVPEALDWQFLVYDDSPAAWHIVPQLPNRPVVARCDHPVTVPPGQRVMFYALVPVTLEVRVGGTPGIALATVRSEILSDTWFGTPVDGILCYALKASTIREREDCGALPHHAVCPFEIHNRGREPLSFDRLCLRTQHLALYSGHHFLWGSVVKIEYNGESGASQIRYGDEAPAWAPDAVRLAGPSKQAEQGLLRMTFNAHYANDLRGNAK